MKEKKGHRIGRFFHEFEINSVIEHSLSKTIYESDNNLFSLITMNYHPIHTNSDFAKEEHHGQILVVGTLVFSLSVGLTVPDISGKAIANLEYESISHIAPVFINDTIYAKTIILDKRLSKSKPDRGVVYVETIVTNQNSIVVLKFKRKVLIKVT